MKKQLSIWATQEEVAKLELIRNFHKRNTLSDTLRHLINSEHEKIFSKSSQMRQTKRNPVK